MQRKQRFETPGTLAIMVIYLALFLATWLAFFAYLAVRWAIE